MTAIYITHCPEELPSAIRRVLHLRHGRAHVESR